MPAAIVRRGDSYTQEIEKLDSTSSEAGVVATLIHHPEFSFYSEDLRPLHFADAANRAMYTAICELAKQDVTQIDAYMIFESLCASPSTRKLAESITVERILDFVDTSVAIARHTVEEYQVLVRNVLRVSFRRDAYQALRGCERLCIDGPEEDIEEKLYSAIDKVMMEYSSAYEIPPFKDVVDRCWEEIRDRQKSQYAGIPFKFPTLNEYATIEPGELFIFAAEAKQGKSMMLLNCAVDLLRRDLAVLYLDSELNTRLFTARLLAHLTGIEYRRLTTGNYSPEEAARIDEQLAWLKTRKFTHIYIPMFDQHTIYTSVKKVRHTQGLDVLIVDYFKGSGDGDAFDSYQELGRFVDMIKNKVCGDMGICGIGAAQATVSGKVADSAKIGRNASTIALIQEKTPEEIEADGVECGNKKLRVVLNRNGMQMAPGEYIDLRFDGNHILYEEARQHVPQQPF